MIGLILGALMLFGCSKGSTSHERRPVVLAAASMQESLTDAARQWAASGRPEPILSFAASSALARQIESGAKADLFISADEDWMSAVESMGLARSGSRRILVRNALVLIAPMKGPRSVALTASALKQALGTGRLAIADPESVPAGKYGKAALERLALWPILRDRLADGENVRAALAFVERGEAPLGIVYLTDAKVSKKVRVVATFPENSHPPIVYPIVLGRMQVPAAPQWSSSCCPRGRRRSLPLMDSNRARPMLSAEEYQILELSVRVSIVAVVVALPIAFAFAWLLSRVRFRGRVLVDAVVHLPLVIPPVVTGWILLIMFGANGPIGGWLEHTLGITLIFRWTGAALAAAIMAFPLMVRAMRLSIEAVDRRLEEASRTLGSGAWATFWKITLPLSMPGIAAACVLGFARSLGEFGATITFVSNIPGQTRTLPLAIYAALQIPGHEYVAARLAVLSIILSLGALVGTEWLTRRSVGRAVPHVL